MSKRLRLNFILALSLPVIASNASAVSLCTPSTISAATIATIKPYLQLPAVNSLLACSPDTLMLTPQGMLAIYRAPLIDSKVEVYFDQLGVVGAIYFNATLLTSTFGFRQLSPPVPTNWQIIAR